VFFIIKNKNFVFLTFFSDSKQKPGLWVTQQFRLRRPWSMTKFIAFSGSNDDFTRQCCKEMGMIAPYILNKPVDSKQFKQVLNFVFPKKMN
jgi:hypothetical protein